MKDSDKKDIWLVVVNVFAASKKAGSVWKKAAAMLEEANVSYKAMFTGGPDNAIAISRKSCARGYRRFIAVGGDGTVHDVLNGIAEYVYSGDGPDVAISDFTLGVLPVGSGNDWVKSTGVPRDIKGAVDVIAAGCTGLQDVVRVEVLDPSDYASAPLSVSYMANVGGVGLDARVCEIVNRKKEQGRRGKKLYVSALLYCIKHRVPIRAKVVCDGKEVFAGRYLSIAFGVGRYSGGGMRQTPLAELGDGLLDVTVIPDIPIWTIAKEVPRLFTGTFHKVDVLTMAKCREVLVLPDGEADAEPAEVDGEVVGRAPVRMTVLDEQIRVVMPDLH
jgi:YegS/Rv2252/BmrU family lipid kinase